MGKRGIRYVMNDSWEAGSQNWTDDMIAQFKKRRGYDPLPWMPVLTGQVVESAEASDRFLWDFRKTIGDLIADEHYGQLEASLHEWGMGHYGESHEAGRAFVADGMEVKKFNEVPMSAMWTQTPGREQGAIRLQCGRSGIGLGGAYLRSEPGRGGVHDGGSSALGMVAGDAEADGRPGVAERDQPLCDPRVGAPAAGGQGAGNDPRALRAVVQPQRNLGGRGRSLDDYIARSSYLLQQGHFGADLVYFYGEDSNLTAIFDDKAPDVPAGYGFDYINADGLIHELNVTNGRITTKSGMSYRVLGLDPYSQHMSLPVLRAIHQLVEDGAVVAGPKPTDDPSLADDQAEFRKLNDELFGDGTGVHNVGKGTVYAGQSLTDVFNALEGGAGLRLHQAGERHAASLCASQAGGWRSVLRG